MTYQPADISDDQTNLPHLPSWVTASRAETPENVAFLSGAALATLHLVVGRPEVPHALWRERLALRAAEACVAFSGRLERAGELRDAVHLARPGDLPGPAGAVFVQWRLASARPISMTVMQKVLPAVSAEQIAIWFDAGQGGPVARAACVLETVLSEFPREETAALILANAALAQDLGWEFLLPILATGLKRRDLRKTGEDLQLACHKAVVTSAGEAARVAADLTRRAGKLEAVTPKLRAKRAGAAVQLFLSRDAVIPATLPLPDRAARRLCDRLVELGVVRELTGRDTFRIYGL